jgi:hypothetical protein
MTPPLKLSAGHSGCAIGTRVLGVVENFLDIFPGMVTMHGLVNLNGGDVPWQK